MIAWFLSTKLIAREGQNLQPLTVVLVRQGGHLCIVFLGQTSLRGNIDDHDDIALVVGHRNFFAHHVTINQLVKGRL